MPGLIECCPTHSCSKYLSRPRQNDLQFRRGLYEHVCRAYSYFGFEKWPIEEAAWVFRVRSERLFDQARVWDQQRAVLEDVQLAAGEREMVVRGGRQIFEPTDVLA
jgi:hypothetical protein